MTAKTGRPKLPREFLRNRVLTIRMNEIEYRSVELAAAASTVEASINVSESARHVLLTWAAEVLDMERDE